MDKNPENYFADVEQIAFNVAHMVNGIEPSPDKMLQGRLFSYGDTQRHRLGPNHLQLPVNCPYKVKPFIFEKYNAFSVTYINENAIIDFALKNLNSHFDSIFR